MPRVQVCSYLRTIVFVKVDTEMMVKFALDLASALASMDLLQVDGLSRRTPSGSVTGEDIEWVWV